MLQFNWIFSSLSLFFFFSLFCFLFFVLVWKWLWLNFKKRMEEIYDTKPSSPVVQTCEIIKGCERFRYIVKQREREWRESQDGNLLPKPGDCQAMNTAEKAGAGPATSWPSSQNPFRHDGRAGNGQPKAESRSLSAEASFVLIGCDVCTGSLIRGCMGHVRRNLAVTSGLMRSADLFASTAVKEGGSFCLLCFRAV